MLVAAMARRLLVIVVAGLPAAALAAPPIDAVSGGGLGERVRELRLELARARLELGETRSEIERMRAFLEQADPEADTARWRRQRLELMERRRALVAERREIERRRRELLAEGPPEPGRAVDREPPGLGGERGRGAPPVASGRPRWEMDYRIAAIPLDGQPPVFVEPVFGRLLVGAGEPIDRNDILVRGTLQNRSAEPWRYTFEVRLGDRSGDVIGRWRYQTPLLGPNELHEFEIKVLVADVGRIRSYQIGNITADQPEK